MGTRERQRMCNRLSVAPTPRILTTGSFTGNVRGLLDECTQHRPGI